MDAVVEIDYAGQSVNFGVFLDRRAALDAGGGRFVSFLPELNQTSGWAAGKYVFAPGAEVFSASDYEWLWFSVSKDFNTLRYVFKDKGQKTSKGNHYICGISCVKATSTSATTLASGYDVIYQANFNSSDTDGMYFKRN